MQHRIVLRNAAGLSLAASLLVSTQQALAADEINITPRQRQITADKAGIVTLRFDVENRSGQTQQLEESLSLPDGWELVTNTAPFLLANGARETRLIHIVVPRDASSGSYPVSYQLTAQDNGAITSLQTIQVYVAEQAGIKLAASTPPSSLLGGESYSVDFTLKNTGNNAVTYKLSGSDEENYITSVTPKTLTLAAGESGNITVQGKIPANLEETTSYRVSLQAKGGGKLAEESVTIPLIARTPKGLSKYQKLPGQLTTRYTQRQHQNADGSTSNDYQAQVEYHARGALDSQGKHTVDVRLRNGKNRNEISTANNQQSRYEFTYDNGTWEVKAGHQTFQASNLTGNTLDGVGVETTYRPQNKKQRRPLKARVFSGKSRSGDAIQKRVSGTEIHYQWDKVDAGVNILQYDQQATTTESAKKDTITSINAGWRGENVGVRTEVAKDTDGKAWSIDANGQWSELGVNVSHLEADNKFNGNYTDTQQSFANARYQLDDKTSVEVFARHTRNNLSGSDPAKEIREDKEQRARISHKFGDEQQIEVSAGYTKRSEKDLRISPTTDRQIHAANIEYQQQFEDFHLSAEVAHGTRKDRIAGDGQGSKYGLTISWQPSKKFNSNLFYTFNNNLDNSGKSYTSGANIKYQINQKTSLSGYVQRDKNPDAQTYANSFEARLNHNMKSWGMVGISARRVNSKASDGTRNHDNIVQLEYTVPLDMPIRRRHNLGSVKGKLHYADDKRPASDVVVQMGGQYAVTDNKGEFFYPSVAAQEYTLQVDASRNNSQGYMLNSKDGEPNITVLANKTTEPELELTPAARLTGTIQLYEQDAGSSLFSQQTETQGLRPSKGVGMMLVELHPVEDIGKRIVYKRTTLYDGSFSFLGIPPGKWKLVVADSNKLPPNYRLEESQLFIDLSEGGAMDLAIRAIPSTQGIKKTGPSGGFDVTG